MNPEDRVDMAVRLFAMNETMRDLRGHIDQAAELSKELGATDLAFATYLLSDMIGTYMAAVNRYVTRELT